MPTNRPRTFCITPKGRGAIATVVVQGAAALAAIDQCFRSVSGKLVSETAVGQILFGSWTAPTKDCDSQEDLVVCRIDEQTTEVHCHGGIQAPANIIRNLVSLGCVEVDANSWSFEQHGNIASEAMSALAQAPTERTALFLLEQSRGLLETEVRTLAKLTLDAPSLAEQRLKTLLLTAEFGIHLTQPWNVVLAGPPNVGKSSLMNALAGFKRSIVYNQPGTTRDVISFDTAFDGWPVRLTDTAGIRHSQFELESKGIERAKHQMDEADLVILVSDTSDQKFDESIAKISKLLRVRNKCDLLSETPSSGESLIFTSAIKGIGINKLVAKITSKIVPNIYCSTSPLIFSRRQKDRLDQVLVELQNGNYKGAKAILEENLLSCQPKSIQ